MRWRLLPTVEGTVFENLSRGPLPCEAAQLLREVLEPPCQATRTPQSARGQMMLSARLSRGGGTCLLDRERAQSLGIIFKRFLVPFDLFCKALDTLNFSLHVSEEDIDGWLQAWPTEEEQKRVLEFKGSKAELRDVERNVRQIAKVPRSDARLKLLRLSKGLDDLRSIIGVRLFAIKSACTVLLGSSRWRELLASVLQHGNFINGGFNDSGARGFSLDALQLLKGLKGSHGNSVLHCLCIFLAKEDPCFCDHLLEELERVPLAAQYNLGSLQDALRKLTKDLDFAEKELVEHSDAYRSNPDREPGSPGLVRGTAQASSAQVFDIASARGDAPPLEAPTDSADLMPPRSSSSASEVVTPRCRDAEELPGRLTDSPARKQLRQAAEGRLKRSPPPRMQTPTSVEEEWSPLPLPMLEMPGERPEGQRAADRRVPQLRLQQPLVPLGLWAEPLNEGEEGSESSSRSTPSDEEAEPETLAPEAAKPASSMAARRTSPETCSTSTGSANSDDVGSPRKQRSVSDSAMQPAQPARTGGSSLLSALDIQPTLCTPRDSQLAQGAGLLTPRAVTTPRGPQVAVQAAPELLGPSGLAAAAARPGAPLGSPRDPPSAGTPEIQVLAPPPCSEPLDACCPTPMAATAACSLSLGGSPLLLPPAHGSSSPAAGSIAGTSPGLPCLTPRGGRLPSPRKAATPPRGPQGRGARMVPPLNLALHVPPQPLPVLPQPDAEEKEFTGGWPSRRPSLLLEDSPQRSPQRSARLGPLGSARKRTWEQTSSSSLDEEVTGNGGGSSWSGTPGKVHFVFALNGSFPAAVEVFAPQWTPQGHRRRNYDNRTYGKHVALEDERKQLCRENSSCKAFAPDQSPSGLCCQTGKGNGGQALEQLEILVARGRVLVHESSEQLAEVSTAIEKCEKYFGGALLDNRPREGKETIRLFEIVTDILKQFRIAWTEVHRDERWAQYMPHARSGRGETPLTAREFRKRRHPCRKLCWT